MHAGLRRRHPEHAEERRERNLEAERTADAVGQLPADRNPVAVRHAPGSTSSTVTASVCPAFAPRTSIGPASAWPS